jgi:hypothetical protein
MGNKLHAVKVEDHEGHGICRQCDRENLRWIVTLSDGSTVGTECARTVLGYKPAPASYRWVEELHRRGRAHRRRRDVRPVAAQDGHRDPRDPERAPRPRRWRRRSVARGRVAVVTGVPPQQTPARTCPTCGHAHLDGPTCGHIFTTATPTPITCHCPRKD